MLSFSLPGYKYLPLYRDSIDRIEGFLNVALFFLSGERDLTKATIPALFIPETIPLDALLTTLRSGGHRVACAKDEFGGTAGIVTQGDVLEEIATDVRNRRFSTIPAIRQLAADRWAVHGSTSLEELNYSLGFKLEAEGVDRVGGWISTPLERIPRPGDKVESRECRATVMRVERERVIEAIIERIDRGSS